MEGEVLTEVPVNLQKLLQQVVRGFYTVEDMLIVDMLVRNLCLSEDSICDLLKFDRKMLRQRINTLKTDKLLQTRMKMITLEDGKTQREQYYFINYKSFVNVIKYKLDHIRKKLEMEERDQTSRASFVCHNCQRTYTDLEADQLLDAATGELVCIICRAEVQEDSSATPRQDSRLLLTRFNNQMEPLFSLLKEVENIKLSSEFSDPKPQEYDNGKKVGMNRNKNGQDNRTWSGDATKKHGFQVEGSIDVNINTENTVEEAQKAKEQPSWLSQTASFITPSITSVDSDHSREESSDIGGNSSSKSGHKNNKHKSAGGGGTASDAASKASGGGKLNSHDTTGDDVLSLLQANERKGKRSGEDSDSDDSGGGGGGTDEPAKKKPALHTPFNINEDSLDGLLDSEDSDASDGKADRGPLISVGRDRMPISQVDNSVISRMTQEEKNLYINAYQEFMAGMDDL